MTALSALLQRAGRSARLLAALAGTAVLLSGALPAAAVEVLSSEVTPVQMTVSSGELIRLDRPADAVFIADPEIADLEVMSPKLVYVFARMPGQTNLFAVDKKDRLVANLHITVEHDVERLNRTLAAVSPGNGVQAASVDGSLVLTGQLRSAGEAADAARLASAVAGGAEKVINRTRVRGTNQVNIRVRVAEVQREAVSRLGINWDALASPGNFLFGLATNNPAVIGGSFLTRTDETNSIVGGFRGGDLDVNTVIDALEQANLVSILAEPNLTSTSGETATFLSGGEFPVPVPQDADTITIEYKKFGVSLSFTPTLLDDSLISMRVRPEVSQLSTNGAIEIRGFTVPALTTRRAETTIELSSGQSFAIAGLFQRDISRDVRDLPGVGELPVLGDLFRSSAFRNQETELVIVVTPYLVKPVSDGPPMLPNEPLESADTAYNGAQLAKAGGGGVGVGVGQIAGFILK